MALDNDDLLDTRALRAFDALYTTRSVSRAAAELGWSQPTVSTWLARLRANLRDPLFVRTASGMEPTPRADLLVATCRSALTSLARLSAPVAAFDPGSTRRTFRICVTDASHVTLLPLLQERVRNDAPLSRLEVLRIGAETPGLLLSGEADIAIGMLPELEAGFYQQRLYDQDWVCLIGTGTDCVGDRLDGRSYAEGEHLSVASGASRRLLEDELRRLGVTRRVALELPGFLGVPAILRRSPLIATVPRLIGECLRDAGGVRLLPCPIALASFEVKQHWHERFHHDGGNQWLRALCATLFRGDASSGRRP